MYSNSFTRSNPGLIIFLVDQSGSTEDKMPDGFTIADHIADLVNANITEAISGVTIPVGDDDEMVKRSICFAILAYGGKGNPNDENDVNNWQAELLMAPRWSDEISSDLKKEKSSISNLDVFPVLKPISGGGTPMASAFKTAVNVIKQWNHSHDQQADPAPVIINISDGEPTDNVEDLRKAVDEINSLKNADGSPLIINLHLSAKKEATELKTPDCIDACFDGFSKLMFDISTEVTSDFINNRNSVQSLGIKEGSRLFCSNIKDTAYAKVFLELGTRVKVMK